MLQVFLWPHRDSNPDRQNRNLIFYPLNYGAWLYQAVQNYIFSRNHEKFLDIPGQFVYEKMFVTSGSLCINPWKGLNNDKLYFN